MAQTCFG